MNNSLMVYLNKRLHHDDRRFTEANRQPGPVICISREVGCGALNLAGMLAAELDKKGLCRKWRVLSKEILEESARELDMDPNKLKNYLNDGDRGVFDDILAAFNEKRFKSDRKISKTLIDLIHSFAIDGHCIIVGRAGHIIAKDIEKSLLVRLTAPYDWRVKEIMRKNNLNLRQAMEFIEKTEKERENLRKHIAGDAHVSEEFDITINLSRVKLESAVQMIVNACECKGLVEINKSKVEVF
ncbi:MAG TPA: cytidylate kinase-like family protein [Prolixibacteraceae bacterium]|jgi:cytidylate kinase|nr:cytidylate kinase-like family protein [Prolixibacteraceae bacterium]